MARCLFSCYSGPSIIFHAKEFDMFWLFKMHLSVVLNLQVFEVVRIALQNIKTDGSRFLFLRNENSKPSDVFPTSAMQPLAEILLSGDTSGFTLRMSF